MNPWGAHQQLQNRKISLLIRVSVGDIDEPLCDLRLCLRSLTPFHHGDPDLIHNQKTSQRHVHPTSFPGVLFSTIYPPKSWAAPGHQEVRYLNGCDGSGVRHVFLEFVRRAWIQHLDMRSRRGTTSIVAPRLSLMTAPFIHREKPRPRITIGCLDDILGLSFFW